MPTTYDEILEVALSLPPESRVKLIEHLLKSLSVPELEASTSVCPLIDDREKWLWQNSIALASVQRGLAQVAKGEVYNLGDFSQYQDLETVIAITPHP